MIYADVEYMALPYRSSLPGTHNLNLFFTSRWSHRSRTNWRSL